MKKRKGVTLTELLVTSIISVFIVISLLGFVKVAYEIYYKVESRTKIQTTVNHIKYLINSKVKAAKNMEKIGSSEFKITDSSNNVETIKCVNDTMFFDKSKFYINDKTNIILDIIDLTSEELEYSIQISDHNIDSGIITTTVRRKNITVFSEN